MRSIQYIIVHCTAGSQQTTTVEKLKSHWRGLGWHAPGYHYVVFPSGHTERLAEDDTICNGVKGYNAASLHVAYVGGIDRNGKPIDNRTEAQKAALYFLLEQLKSRYPAATLAGHRDFSPDLDGNGEISEDEFIKYCPCFDVKSEYAGLQRCK